MQFLRNQQFSLQFSKLNVYKKLQLVHTIIIHSATLVTDIEQNLS